MQLNSSHVGNRTRPAAHPLFLFSVTSLQLPSEEQRLLHLRSHIIIFFLKSVCIYVSFIPAVTKYLVEMILQREDTF